eukprot:753852-Hanusia_phi.AAC.1
MRDEDRRRTEGGERRVEKREERREREDWNRSSRSDRALQLLAVVGMVAAALSQSFSSTVLDFDPVNRCTTHQGLLVADFHQGGVRAMAPDDQERSFTGIHPAPCAATCASVVLFSCRGGRFLAVRWKGRDRPWQRSPYVLPTGSRNSER